MEYRDESALNIYTDGSSFQRPRRGGVGIVFVSVGDDGHEVVDEFPLPGFEQANNNQMELQAVIEALKAIATGRAPVHADDFKRIVVWTDSLYVVNGYQSAIWSWPRDGWMTRAGNPVANQQLWQELLRWARKAHRIVEIRWVKGHKQSAPNKRADKLAKESASRRTARKVGVAEVRRKKTHKRVERGSVEMHGQRATIRIITSELTRPGGLMKYRYEVMSRASPFRGNVDLIYADPTLPLRAGHTYRVRFNSDARAPRIVKCFAEVLDASKAGEAG